jgi:hypothetical protein
MAFIFDFRPEKNDAPSRTCRRTRPQDGRRFAVPPSPTGQRQRWGTVDIHERLQPNPDSRVSPWRAGVSALLRTTMTIVPLQLTFIRQQELTVLAVPYHPSRRSRPAPPPSCPRATACARRGRARARASRRRREAGGRRQRGRASSPAAQYPCEYSEHPVRLLRVPCVSSTSRWTAAARPSEWPGEQRTAQ